MEVARGCEGERKARDEKEKQQTRSEFRVEFFHSINHIQNCFRRFSLSLPPPTPPPKEAVSSALVPA